MKVHCLLDCSECPLFFAEKRGHSPEQKKEIADNWGRLMNVKIEVTQLNCEGCISENLFEHCRKCRFRDCNKDKGIEICEECSEYPCDDLRNFTEWFEQNIKAFRWGNE